MTKDNTLHPSIALEAAVKPEIGNTIISIAFSSRFKNNANCNLLKCLDSIVKTTTKEERERLEVLIKMDLDDTSIPDEIIKTFTVIHKGKYFLLHRNYKGIHTRIFIYSRGEGRSDLHNALSYLGTMVSYESAVIMNIADDFIFTKSGWVTNTLNLYDISLKKNKGMLIIGPCSENFTPPSLTENALGKHKKTQDELMPIGKWCDFNYVTHNELDEIINGQKTVLWTNLNQYIGEYCPIFSTKLFNIISGQFWMANIDTYFTILGAVLALKHNIKITSRIENFYIREQEIQSTKELARQHKPVPWDAGSLDYNFNTVFNYSKVRNCKSFFNLLLQQALNIKLNLENE